MSISSYPISPVVRAVTRERSHVDRRGFDFRRFLAMLTILHKFIDISWRHAYQRDYSSTYEKYLSSVTSSTHSQNKGILHTTHPLWMQQFNPDH